MAKASGVAFIASALVVLAIAGSAHCRKEVPGKVVPKEFVLNVTGSVYCDPCRLSSHKLTRCIAGATVELGCNETPNVNAAGRVNKTVKTNENGMYEISMSGVREGDNCIVNVLQSPEAGCNYLSGRSFSCQLADRVDSVAAGCYSEIMISADKADPKCIEVLNERM